MRLQNGCISICLQSHSLKSAKSIETPQTNSVWWLHLKCSDTLQNTHYRCQLNKSLFSRFEDLIARLLQHQPTVCFKSRQTLCAPRCTPPSEPGASRYTRRLQNTPRCVPEAGIPQRTSSTTLPAAHPLVSKPYSYRAGHT